MKKDPMYTTLALLTCLYLKTYACLSIGKISYFFFLLFRLVTIIVTFFISLNRIDASRDKNSRMLIVSLRTLNINVDKYTYIYIQGINIFAE